MPEWMNAFAEWLGYTTMLCALVIAWSNESKWYRTKRRIRRKEAGRATLLRYQKSWRGRLRHWTVNNAPRIAWLRYPEFRHFVREDRPDLHPFRSATDQQSPDALCGTCGEPNDEH